MGRDFTAEFSVNGLEDSLLTTKTSEFTIEDKKTRIFPDIYYNPVVEFGASVFVSHFSTAISWQKGRQHFTSFAGCLFSSSSKGRIL